MASYIPQYVPTTHSQCPVHTSSVPWMATGTSMTEVSAPDPPHVYTVPLPSSSPAQGQPIGYGERTLYPINILSSPPLVKQMELDTRFLHYPIHVHTPQAHIGTIHGSAPGQGVNVLDLFRSLQIFALRPLDPHAVYAQLSQQVKAEVKAAFMRRKGRSSSSTLTWETFTSGQPTHGGPTGEDLLLGNANIWGIEEQSFGDCSILHLA